MKYINVFLVWLWADIILATGCVIFDFNNEIVSVIGIGFVCTLPSLVILIIVHTIFAKYNKSHSNYSTHYLLLIIGVNILYLIFCFLTIGFAKWVSDAKFFILAFACTTLAGIISFFIEQKRIQAKRIV